MGKPDDIPQDVWDLAVRTFAELLTPFRYEDKEAFADAEHIARAIMAAKAEQREADAKMAEGFERTRDWVPGSLYDTLRREVAAAIRGGHQ